MKLEYDNQDFAIAARKAIADGEVVTFEIRGDAWRQLRPYVVNSEVPSWAFMSAIPELRRFAGVMALAEVSNARVRVSAFDNFAEVLVGLTH